MRARKRFGMERRIGGTNCSPLAASKHVIAACTPKAQKGLIALSMRFSRHFCSEKCIDSAVRPIQAGWAKHVLSLTYHPGEGRDPVTFRAKSAANAPEARPSPGRKRHRIQSRDQRRKSLRNTPVSPSPRERPGPSDFIHEVLPPSRPKNHISTQLLAIGRRVVAN